MRTIISMTRKSLKKMMEQRECTFGSWITLTEPAIAEIMARQGFDWLVVDMEHSAITLDVAQNLIRVIELCGCTPFVRVGDNDPHLIKRVMDAGAHGVVVPMVNSANDARRAVEAVRYPPYGRRGVGLARAQGYGMSFEEYKRWNELESIVVVQIEHIHAVENIAEILDVDGVDGFIVGPYDLSGSLGHPGKFEHPLVQDALKKVVDESRKRNALAGFHVISPDGDEVLKRRREGYRFLAISLDTLFIGQSCRRLVQQVRLPSIQ